MSKLSRRQALKAVAAAGVVTGCLPSSRTKEARGSMQAKQNKIKTDKADVAVTPQGFGRRAIRSVLRAPRRSLPAGNERQGPAASLAGRNLGQDFRAGRLAHVPRRDRPRIPAAPAPRPRP
jgi:hypothetical protein